MIINGRVFDGFEFDLASFAACHPPYLSPLHIPETLQLHLYNNE